MRLNYKVNNQNLSIFFCKKKNTIKIAKFLDEINTDKNVLFIFDEKINKFIVDKIYEELKLIGCKIIVIECKGLKSNKNEKLLFKIIDILLKNKFTKNSSIISLGGGVVGDVAAMASSLYLRGLHYVCIPTTMTSIIDSSIGGKTGINYNGVINSVGTYYHPKAVFILESIIETLPSREFYAGIAEIIKCGIIGESKILRLLKTKRNLILKRDIKSVFQICLLTLKTKINFFKNDVFENKERLILNFGHTFAHAIEMSLDFLKKKELIRHGEAVGLGMLCEIYYFKKKKEKIYFEIRSLLKNYFLPVNLKNIEFKINKFKLHNQIYKNIFLDKKKINKYPRYISISNFQRPFINEITDLDFLNDTIHNLIYDK